MQHWVDTAIAPVLATPAAINHEPPKAEAVAVVASRCAGLEREQPPHGARARLPLRRVRREVARIERSTLDWRHQSMKT